MIYIYIELRYQRQLNRICPEILESFFSSFSASVQRNGGSETRVSHGRLFQFDDSSVGSVFASARVIGDVSVLLEKFRSRLKEYFLLIEYTNAPASADSFMESLSVYDTMITPDQAILLTTAAAHKLDSYITAVPLPSTPLLVYTSSHFVTQGETAPAHTVSATPSVSLYTDFSPDPLSAFLNLVRSFPHDDSTCLFNEEELSLFKETQYALDMYARFRFSPQQPEYRIAACLDYFRLFFRSIRGESTNPLSVTVYGSSPLLSSYDSIMEKMSDYCQFSLLRESVFLPCDFQHIPDDLLELSYLVYKSASLLYVDELPSFFVFLGKQADFLSTLGSWLYSYGILSVPQDFRSLNRSLQSQIEEKLGNKKEKLDRHIACYLWSRYEEGILQSGFALYEVFVSLHYLVPDSFLVNSLYHALDPRSELLTIRDRFRNPLLADAVDKLELSRKKYDEGFFDESSALVKNVLHVFQKENVLTGEYRALCLIAMLSLAKNNGDDAVVYLEYALENAEKMHDSSAILCTSFDMAMVYFIIGNFHFALCTLDAVEKIVSTCYAKDWEVLLLFMKGRIAFELGNYREAELLFQTAASLASVHQIPESVSLCRVWYARSLAHQTRFATAENIFVSCASLIPEAYIFLMESALLSGRPLAGIVFPEKITTLFNEKDRWSTEFISWKSGYSFAEDRCFGSSGEKRLAVRMYEALTLYYRARFNVSDDVPLIVSQIASIARTALDLKDPYAALYYYFCYDLGRKTKGVLPADTTTFLSRGFKYMQKRANEIEENSIREQYMQNATWNSRLYRTARENMLI